MIKILRALKATVKLKETRRRKLSHRVHSTSTRNLSIYNIIRWANGTNDWSSKPLMFQVLFFSFIKSCKILCKNPFNYFSYFLYKIKKKNLKSSEFPKSIRKYEKIFETSIAWSTIHLSHCIGPSNQCIIF